MRLIAFGCSHTYGEGITQEDFPGRKIPSKYSWASVLGRKCNIPVINLSDPGASNQNILNQIKNHKWQKNDIALILFTVPLRYTYYIDEKTSIKLNPNYIRKLSEEEGNINDSFYRLFNEYHLEKINLLDIEHIYLFLKYHKINFVNRFFSQFGNVYNEVNQEIKNDLTVSFSQYIRSNLEKDKQLGYDDSHYSMQAHELWADYLQPSINSMAIHLQRLDSNQ